MFKKISINGPFKKAYSQILKEMELLKKKEMKNLGLNPADFTYSVEWSDARIINMEKFFLGSKVLRLTYENGQFLDKVLYRFDICAAVDTIGREIYIYTMYTRRTKKPAAEGTSFLLWEEYRYLYDKWRNFYISSYPYIGIDEFWKNLMPETKTSQELSVCLRNLKKITRIRGIEDIRELGLADEDVLRLFPDKNELQPGEWSKFGYVEHSDRCGRFEVGLYMETESNRSEDWYEPYVLQIFFADDDIERISMR